MPVKIANGMLDETESNFKKEEYGNEGRPMRWPDRYGYIKGTLRNAEPFLNYRKLDYTGRLRKSIRKQVQNNTVAVGTNVKYAELQNTGKGTTAGGRVIRKPPKSTMPLILGRHPRPRKFLGFGLRTKKMIAKEYADLFNIL